MELSGWTCMPYGVGFLFFFFFGGNLSCYGCRKDVHSGGAIQMKSYRRGDGV